MLLLCCARTRLGAEKAERLHGLLHEKLDWFYLVEAAVQHGMTPLLYWHLHNVDPEAVPAMWMEFLRASFEGNVAGNLDLPAQLLRILEIFQANGILAVPYKGPALAALAYGNLALRDFVDLDLLVRAEDVSRASELLVSQGYRPGFDLPATRAAAWKRIPGQYLFTGDGNRSIVELHTPLTLRYYPVPLDLGRLSRRLEVACLGGREIRTFSAEDSRVSVCVQSSKHFWERLAWICDVAELVQVPRGINWKLVQEEARRLGCERMLLLGLCLANELLEAPLPEEVSRRVKANSAVQALAAQVRGQLFRQPRTWPSVLRRFLFRLRISENPWRGARHSWRLAMTPTEEDWKFVRLPASLEPLYALLRPLRLVRKHGLGIVRRTAPDLAPFVPTPLEIVEHMLELGEVGPNDVLYDLGCGDGRVVVTAAKRFGIRAVGVDSDPRRIAEAKANARRHGVQHLVRFVQQDAKTVDMSGATVVTLYLTLVGNLKLLRRLQEQLPPGARIVSRDFAMPGWSAEKTERIKTPAGLGTTLYLWRAVAARKRWPLDMGAMQVHER
jgi:hypothetical protein